MKRNTNYKNKKKKKNSAYQHNLINNRRFVLEAEEMYNKYGQRTHVNRMINFVALDSTNVTFQFDSDNSLNPNRLFINTLKEAIAK